MTTYSFTQTNPFEYYHYNHQSLQLKNKLTSQQKRSGRGLPVHTLPSMYALLRTITSADNLIITSEDIPAVLATLLFFNSHIKKTSSDIALVKN